MPKLSVHKTEAEAKSLGFLCKKELKLIGLMPSQRQRPAASVWQGRAAYSVWNPNECIPYKYEVPTGVLRKRECRDEAREWLSFSPLVLDCESTGLDESAEVVEISLVDAVCGEVVFTALCKPLGKMNEAAFNIHGIGDEMLADKPTWVEIYPSLVDAMQGRHIVIYNANFDKKLIFQSCQQNGLDEIQYSSHCMMDLYSRFFGEKDSKRGGYRWQNLKNAMIQSKLELRNGHRATEDCFMTVDLLNHVAFGKSKRRTVKKGST